jgi:hypothetical protein
MDGPAIARPSGGAGVPDLVADVDSVSPKYDPRDTWVWSRRPYSGEMNIWFIPRHRITLPRG